MEVEYKDIMRYGERSYELDLDKHVSQFIYSYENNTYVITMKNGKVITLFKVSSGGVYKK